MSPSVRGLLYRTDLRLLWLGFRCSIQFCGTMPVRFEVVALSGIEKRLNSLTK